MCVFSRSSSHTCLSFAPPPQATGNLTEGGEEGGGGVGDCASISPAQRAVSGLVLAPTAGGDRHGAPRTFYLSFLMSLNSLPPCINSGLSVPVFFLSAA